ncbi:MAG: S-layer homology domain-containing protein, partial [Clostridia bacterium]|nr:S-layer homology domain-containing protein [Clostridia bacterium]
MKNSLFLKLFALVLAVVALTAAVGAQGFTKTQEYPEGKFTDVPANQWYAAEVKSAYELGFMNGQSDTAFAPNGNVTVAEGITMASRVHSIYNGKEIKSVEGTKWYDMYIAYAKENGLIEEGQFTNYDRNIMRYEMAVMFANAMPADYFAAKNNIKDIPDVAETEEYYDELMMLYNAGVVMGSDDYGNFFATNSIKRSETAAIINRVALPENRKTGTLAEYGDRNPAVYLIEDESMSREPRSVKYIASGWTYENPSNSSREKKDFSSNVLEDFSSETKVTARKEITTINTGLATLETSFNVSAPGYRVYFEDLEGNKLFEISNKNKVFSVIGDEQTSTSINFSSGNIILKLEMDLDSRQARVVINNMDIGTFKMSTSAADLSRLVFSTLEQEMISMTINSVILYWNYDVNEDFRFGTPDTIPFGWEVENTLLKRLISDSDTVSAAINGMGKAVKNFDKVSGSFVYETYFLVTEQQDATLAIMNGDKTAFSMNAKNGKITTADGKLLRNYTPGVWQQLRVEADTEKGTALIKINGKDCITVPFTEDGIDNIVISASGSGDFYFDDVRVFNTFEYPDYCPVPVPVNDDEWYSGMSVCSLWREGSHYGWDCIAPYEDLTPVLGYYDEGIPEAMDWEIKFLVEHGYDYQRFCWYYGDLKEHIKKPRLCDDAIHDGYFNAKYSDMLDFVIMWENAGSKSSKEEFYNNIWPYWVDWYLTDSRYFCIDNKPVITIYSASSFKEIMGGTAGVKQAIDFMEAECKKLGFDGVIVYCSHSSGTEQTNIELAQSGYDAKAAYHFGERACDIEYQKKRMIDEFNIGHITFSASVGIGYNDIGWTETRTPLATADEFEEILRWSRDEFLPMYKDRDVDEWHTKSILTNTWNEFGEGHYVFPSAVNGFGYMDAHRHVFSTVADTDDSKHFDVFPTDNQKSRLGYLYNTRHIPMRKTHLADEDDIDYNKLIRIKSWNFENSADCDFWGALAKTTTPKYDAAEKALVGATTDIDGHIKMHSFVDNYFNADDVKWLHVCMKLDESSGSTAEIYFTNDTKGMYSSSMGCNFTVLADGKYHDYYVDLSTLPTWSGDIKSLRFDPVNVPTRYYIKTIEFLSEISDSSRVFYIDGVDIAIDEGDYTFVDGELYVNANPTTGFYNLNQFYYEWNRWNGTLLLRTNDGTQFDFVVGRDKVFVNGKEQNLKKNFAVNDGLAELPITFIYDTAGYDYTVSEKEVMVNVRGEDIKAEIESRVANEYEFNVPGDLEGWKIYVASGGVNDGYIKMASFIDEAYNRYDPQLSNSTVKIDTKIYDSVTIRIKPELDSSDGRSSSTLCMYFATTLDGSLDEQKKVLVDLSTLTPDDDGFVTATLDLKSHEKWRGVCTHARIDPPDRLGTFTIDYIRFNINPDYLEWAEQAGKVEREAQENLLLADEGKAFYVKNCDAEVASIFDEFSSGHSKVYVVDDDHRPGNKAFLVTTDKTDTKVWTYIC